MASSTSSSSSSGPKPMNDDVFSERVKKTFGSLFGSLQPSPSPSPSSLSNPLWSLSSADVQKKEWRRDKDTSARDSTPCSSSFDDFISHPRKKNYRKELEDDLHDLDDEAKNDAIHGDIDDWDVRSTIGLDPTLDNEEEEDTFDKVAIGRENAGDRLYMRDVIANRDVDFKSEDDIPRAVGNRQRDPRANLLAAKIRLNEDDVEAAAAQTDQPKPNQQAPPPPQAAEKKSSRAGEDGDKLKPILKRKEHETTTKASKRVRFDPECLSATETVVGDISPPGIGVTEDNNGSRADEKVSRVPDYVQNPSKYTRYSLECVDDMSDKSNSAALFDFLEMAKKAKNGGMGSEEIDAPPMDLPKSVTFVPKKKSDIADKSDGGRSETSQDRQSDAKSFSIQPNLLGLAAEDDRETGVGDMDVDEPEGSAEADGGTTFKKQGRQYRSKSRTDEEEA